MALDFFRVFILVGYLFASWVKTGERNDVDDDTIVSQYKKPCLGVGNIA